MKPASNLPASACSLVLTSVWILCGMASVAAQVLGPSGLYTVPSPELAKLSLDAVEKTADAGDAVAMAELGERYLMGRGLKKYDFPKALEWFRRAAAKENSF